MRRERSQTRWAAVGLLAATVLLTMFPPVGAPDNPFVVRTDPADRAVDVPLYLPIVVEFSQSMNRSNVVVEIQPDVAFTRWWLNGDYSLMLMHAADFTPCTTYWVRVDGADKQGLGIIWNETLGVPNPWRFTTTCPVFAITRTNPLNNQTWIPTRYDPSIVVWFSQPADRATLQVTASPFLSLSPSWSNGDRQVAFPNATPFFDCTWYTIAVSARDTLGRSLTNVTGTPPNPWRFWTPCVQPRILATEPLDGAAGVDLYAPVVVTFSNPMNRNTVWWSVLPTPALPFNASWASGDTVLTLVHGWPFNRSTTYTVFVGGWDTGGMQLVAGPVPNPWSFTTAALPAPRALQVARSSPDVALTWAPVPGASSYAAYAAPDKFDPWPWVRLGTTATNRFVHAGADGDGTTHFYVVRAVDGTGGEGANSTMGVKLVLPFAFDPTRTNIYWFSLPYGSGYRTAKDISDALTEANIDVVARWDPARQAPRLWVFLRGAWRGEDFPIGTGDGLWVGIRATFAWVLNGTEGTQPLRFRFNMPPQANVDWFGLPYTSAYRRASELVLEIEGGTGPTDRTWITEVGKWDADRQTILRFRFTSSGWSGTDFSIAPGDGLYFRLFVDLTWRPRLIIADVP